MKTCSVCSIAKNADDFEPQRGQCRDCRKASMKVRRAAYYAKTREVSIAKAKSWREQNPERRLANRKKEYSMRSDAAKEAARIYRKDNPEKVNAWSRKHQLAKRHRTPAWLSVDDYWMMEQAYELAQLRTKIFGFEWQVDHKIPLQGRLVSGLHVPHNLQVIPAVANRSKSNKFVTN
jgi:hypothetical protein